jgi:hypothetical protein
MDKVFRMGCIVVIGCLTGLGGVWADQTLADSLQQDGQALSNQVSANENLMSAASLDNTAGSKSSAKSVKLGSSSSKKSTKKSTKKKSSKTKKSTTKKSKKSKSKKSKKTAEPAA